MKKNVLIIASCLVALTMFPAITNAQFAKGNMLVEGSIGNIDVSKTKTETERSGNVDFKNETKDFSIAIMPRIGFFLSNNLVVGTTLGISFNSSKTDYFDVTDGHKYADTKYSSTTLDLLQFVRYYFPSKNVKTRFYGQIGGGISLDLSAKNEGRDFSTSGQVTSSSKYNYPKKFNKVSGEALVGLNHFISQNVAINAGLGYNYSRSTVTTSFTSAGGTTSTPSKYTVKTGAFLWNVGFTMIIPCKKKK